MIFGLAQLLVGADTEAVENGEVDLADSPRVSPVRLRAATVAGWLAAWQPLNCS
jgi:hypothetical protein